MTDRIHTTDTASDDTGRSADCGSICCVCDTVHNLECALCATPVATASGPDCCAWGVLVEMLCHECDSPHGLLCGACGTPVGTPTEGDCWERGFVLCTLCWERPTP